MLIAENEDKKATLSSIAEININLKKSIEKLGNFCIRSRIKTKNIEKMLRTKSKERGFSFAVKPLIRRADTELHKAKNRE